MDRSLPWLLAALLLAAPAVAKKGPQELLYVSEGNRDAWIALFAEDGVVQDPVGISPLDPEGNGQIGHEGIGAFYDKFISKGKVSFDYPRSYAAGDECAFIGSVFTRFPGVEDEMESEGVFVYKVNEEGKIVSLRAFWEWERRTLDGDIHPPVGR